MQPSNTPPDGDFVRYLDQLTKTAQTVPRLADMRSAPPASSVHAAKPAATDLLHVDKQLSSALTGVPFLTHVKWIAAAWIGSQVLGQFLPGSGFLFIPAVLAYLAWLVFKSNRDSSGALARKLRGLAAAAVVRATEEAKKAQQPQFEK